MTQTSGSFWAMWPQLLYTVPTILVAIAAAVVCVMNWQKAPTAAMFCLLGFGLIGFSSAFGAVVSAWVIGSGMENSSRAEILSILSIFRIILNTGGLVFVLIAVFTGRSTESKSSPFNTPAGSSMKQ